MLETSNGYTLTVGNFLVKCDCSKSLKRLDERQKKKSKLGQAL
jgi:hypothetical protein